MKKTLLKTMILLCALVVGGSAWAEDELVYTLTPATGTNNAYAGNCDITIDEITWNLAGNSQSIPWRIGGKSLTNVDRALYSKTVISDDISKIEVTHGDASSITVNSWTVIVSKNADFSNPVSTLTPTFTASSTTTINRPDGQDWSNCYFKFVYNVSVSGSSNKFIEFSKAEFYKETFSYDINVQSNNLSWGTVSLSGNTITATPATGYRVSTTTPYAVTPEGSATVSQSGNTFTVTPSENTTVIINFEEIPTHNVSFYVNGSLLSETDVYEGSSITFPETNPSSVGGKKFMGWITEEISGTTNTAPSEYYTSGVMGTNDVNYYAVFATKTLTTEEVTKTYGFEEAFDADWTIEGPVRIKSDAYTGSYSGKINSNDTYVIFNNKVKVTEFSFAFKRTSNNNNYCVYIETSTDGSSWTEAEAYEMSSFTNGTYSTRTKTFEGNTELYVRFYCHNTTAVRYVDDVTIKYNVVAEIFSDYCTNIPVPVTITSAKYATYCNATKALDFSETGIMVYTAVDNENSVTLNEITSGQVPANTPVVLYKADADGTAIDVPVIASADAVEGTNDLRVSTGTDVNNMYVLAMNPTIGFYPWKGETDLSAGRVYLQGKASYGTRTFIGFGEETNISNASVNATDNNIWYDLQGRRVAQPTKGLYIVNGKKVVVK